MKTQLYIENKEVEINDEVLFLLNKLFEELDDPTVIINDYSKTVTIPFTEANNRLFGYIYRPERMIVDDGSPDSYKQMNVFFDPYKKLDFKLVYNNTVVMEGYAKMNSIKRNGEGGTYEMTLYGQLGKIFQEMQKITFDRTADDSTYIIDGSTYVDTRIDRNLVYSSWTSSGQHELTLQPILIEQSGTYVSNPDYYVTDIIGFAPNNAYDNGFDHKAYLTTQMTILTFADTLGDSFEEIAGISGSDAIPNGLLPREIGEYRSYLLIPFMYVNKFIQLIGKKTKELTGYSFSYDNSWFNASNPFYSKLVMLLSRPYDNQSKDMYSNKYLLSSVGGTGFYWDYPEGWNVSKDIYLGSFYSGQETFPLLSTDTYTVLTNEKVLIAPMKWILSIPAYYITAERMDIKWKTDKVLQIRRDVINADNNLILDTTYVYYSSGFTSEAYNRFILPEKSYDLTSTLNAWDIVFPTHTITNNIGTATHLKVKYTASFNVSSGDSPFISNDVTYIPNTRSNMSADGALDLVTVTFPAVSNNYITLNDLWNNKVKPFDELIKYCKIFRIGIFTDIYNKKIKFIPLSKYFLNYNILDWTDKLDLNKEFNVRPISFENKYVLFNYKESDLKGQEDYVKHYGFNYGEKRLNTNYNFNDNTKELFKDVYTSINNSDNVLSWITLYNRNEVSYTNCGEIFVLCKDDENKFKKLFGNYFFFNGLADFSSSSPMISPIITDDTTLMSDMNKYCYSQSWNYINVSTYPKLTIDYTENNVKKLCLFGKPKINYSTSQSFTNALGLYDLYWENYINERYNILNKIVTCYLKLSSNDFINFEFKNFIKIENLIYFINKIYDYNIERAGTTKVDLISILDPDEYTR